VLGCIKGHTRHFLLEGRFGDLQHDPLAEPAFEQLQRPAHTRLPLHRIARIRQVLVQQHIAESAQPVQMLAYREQRCEMIAMRADCHRTEKTQRAPWLAYPYRREQIEQRATKLRNLSPDTPCVEGAHPARRRVDQTQVMTRQTAQVRKAPILRIPQVRHGSYSCVLVCRQRQAGPHAAAARKEIDEMPAAACGHPRAKGEAGVIMMRREVHVTGKRRCRSRRIVPRLPGQGSPTIC
jgi:hypothetical protein